jgi:hypothetical protein
MVTRALPPGIQGALHMPEHVAANRVSAAGLFEVCDALGVSLASMFERQL